MKAASRPASRTACDGAPITTCPPAPHRETAPPRTPRSSARGHPRQGRLRRR
jgi:hypothetical protein